MGGADAGRAQMWMEAVGRGVELLSRGLLVTEDVVDSQEHTPLRCGKDL